MDTSDLQKLLEQLDADLLKAYSSDPREDYDPEKHGPAVEDQEGLASEDSGTLPGLRADGEPRCGREAAEGWDGSSAWFDSEQVEAVEDDWL